jgi:ESS family glutamate:Na+ symporter
MERELPMPINSKRQALLAAAFCGLAIGATATAIAIMQPLTRAGAASLVPLIGAFFIGIINAVVLTLFLSLDMMAFR